MRKRKKDQTALDNKLRSKQALKKKREKSKEALKAPEKFIKQYRAQQKSYSHYRLKVTPGIFRINSPRDYPMVPPSLLMLQALANFYWLLGSVE